MSVIRALSITILSLALGFAYGWGFARLSVDEIKTPPTTIEAWGVGYQHGFDDSRTLCEQLLLQQEMMLEYLEQPQAPDRSDSVRGGTDRDGATISGLGSRAIPTTEDGEGQQSGYARDASDWHSGPIRIS